MLLFQSRYWNARNNSLSKLAAADLVLSRNVGETLAKLAPLYLTDSECEGLRKACRFNAQLMDFIRPQAQEGVTTKTINQSVEEYTRDHGHIPACKGYCNYPESICTSVNNVVCHGIPNDTPLQSGDIVNLDLTTIVDGWYGDQSEMLMIGQVSDDAKRLVQVTLDAMFLGIRAIKPHGRINDIGIAIAEYAKEHEFSVVQEYQGHGIGREFHQEPGIPHYPCKAGRLHIKPGTCFTVEPMLNQGTWKTKLDRSDGWTVRTMDGKLSAQWEHTILMTETGPEILTLTNDGPQEGHIF